MTKKVPFTKEFEREAVRLAETSGLLGARLVTPHRANGLDKGSDCRKSSIHGVRGHRIIGKRWDRRKSSVSDNHIENALGSTLRSAEKLLAPCLNRRNRLYKAIS